MENKDKIPLYKTRIYRIYSGMKQRCLNKNSAYYFRYGGRGIKICWKWLGKDGFKNFYNWSMNNGYADNLSIDRINNNGNYCPSNCRWTTAQKQQANKRTTILLRMGKETKPLSHWAKEYNLSFETLKKRLLNGLPLCVALIIPKREKSKRKNAQDLPT